jgi:hypothetical protein
MMGDCAIFEDGEDTALHDHDLGVVLSRYLNKLEPECKRRGHSAAETEIRLDPHPFLK